MTLLALIRHGPTEWNAAGRVQGRTDVPLSESGRRLVSTWRLPRELDGFRWFASPLVRARETAALLGLIPEIEPCLIEMDWGAWEAQVLAELRLQEQVALRERARLGVTFRAPNGETPGDVQRRLAPWLARIGREGRPTGAVAHNGVIRAVYALALAWDMCGPQPHALENGCAQLFRVAADGTPVIERLNLPLTDAPPPKCGYSRDGADGSPPLP